MYRIDGYEFETKELAAKAGKELEGIRYIRSQTRMDDPQVVQKLYDKLILQEIFTTPVGYQFLYELQEYLRAVPSVKTEDIRPIPVYVSDGQKQDESDEDAREAARAHREAQKQIKRMEQTAREAVRPAESKGRNYRRAYIRSMVFSAICVAIIVGMFIITYVSGNNINIINYENRLIDKYESWEEELKEREDAVRQKEAQLDMEPGVSGEE